MEEPTETRPAGAEDLANDAREPDGPPPEVEEEVEEEAKAVLGSEGSRPFTMRELLGELKEDGEMVAAARDLRSAMGTGSDPLMPRARPTGLCLFASFRSHSMYWITVAWLGLWHCVF